MEQKEFAVALDLGTSKMLAMAGTKLNDGTLDVLGAEKIASDNCIRRGCVYNVQVTGTNVRSLLFKLGVKLKSGIKKVYVGIGGQSLRLEIRSEKMEINGTVTDGTIQYLYGKCREYEPDLLEIIDIITPEFYLDGALVSHPQGVYCKEIEAKFRVILGRPSLKTNLTRSVKDTARQEIAGYFISPLATAEVALTARDKEVGVALVELGAGITYLSIYKAGLLQYLVTIPLGGAVITKDISSMGLMDDEAEKLKIKEGTAVVNPEKPERLLDTIVEARVNEILANVLEQIKQSGPDLELGAGIVLTGGNSLMRDLEKAFAQNTRKPVRLVPDIDPTQACAQGMLMLAEENCAAEPKEGLFSPGEIETKTPEKTQPATGNSPRVTLPPVEKQPRPTPEPLKKPDPEPAKEKRSLWGSLKKKASGLADGMTQDLFGEEENK
jgi:cell division protein FtsA